VIQLSKRIKNAPETDCMYPLINELQSNDSNGNDAVEDHEETQRSTKYIENLYRADISRYSIRTTL